jgi:ribose transport system permease protein
MKKWIGEYAAMLVIWVALLLLFGALSEHFLTARTIGTLANRIPALALVATGMTLVLIIGGIDLSVGSVLGLAGAIFGVALVDWQWPLWLAALLCLGTGALAGTANGLVSVRLGIPASS